MRQITAEFKTDTGKLQKVDITHCDMQWILDRKNQIDGIEYKDIDPRNKCERCDKPTDELPRWMKLCGHCYTIQ